MSHRKVFAILDIETITDATLAFDIAWIVYNRKGEELERKNYYVKELADTPFFTKLLSNDKFMKNKCQFYIDGKNDMIIMSLADIANDFNNIGVRYGADVVMCAYNASFDYNVLNDNMQMYTNSNFFEDDIEIVDIMTMALATICDTNKYVRWCQLNNCVTAKGNVRTNAETIYGYLINDANFIEEHHALADCEIETIIYFKSRKYKKKQHKQFASPIFRCAEWKKVQNRR